MDLPPQTCRAYIAALRKRWGLSQSQLARLLMTNRREIRRWEGGEDVPEPHQQWFLQLFVEYVRTNGLRAFRRRFMREAPRYGKVGRPRV